MGGSSSSCPSTNNNRDAEDMNHDAARREHRRYGSDGDDLRYGQGQVGVLLPAFGNSQWLT